MHKPTMKKRKAKEWLYVYVYKLLGKFMFTDYFLWSFYWKVDLCMQSLSARDQVPISLGIKETMSWKEQQFVAKVTWVEGKTN